MLAPGLRKSFRKCLPALALLAALYMPAPVSAQGLELEKASARTANAAAGGLEKLISNKPNAGNTYVVIVGTASDLRQDNKLNHNIPPIDYNADWTSILRSYCAARALGIPEKNITVLYSDGTPNLSYGSGIPNPNPKEDPIFDMAMDNLADCFFSDYGKELLPATKGNFSSVMCNLNKSMDSNNNLIVLLSGHVLSGSYTFIFYGEKDGYYEGRGLTKHEFSEILSKNPAKAKVAVLTLCLGKRFIDDVDYPPGAAVIVGSDSDSYSWVDKYFSLTDMAMQMMIERKNDKNSDGYVSFGEAFSALKEKADNYHKFLHSAILESYPITPASRKKAQVRYFIKTNKFPEGDSPGK